MCYIMHIALLPTVVPVVLRALLYDEKRGTYSVGTYSNYSAYTYVEYYHTLL